MTEGEWLACTDPQQMLDFLRGKASDRKLRLFACACCRRIWAALTDERSRAAVEVAERYADGEATAAELLAACRVAGNLGRGHMAVAAAAGRTGLLDPLHRAKVAALSAASADPDVRGLSFAQRRRAWDLARTEALAAMADLVRCIFANPSHPVLVRPEWRTWHSGTAVRLAQAAYDNRTMPAGTLDNARLAVLADALEEAGCNDEGVLEHLREPGAAHVRGCHLLDALLGKG